VGPLAGMGPDVCAAHGGVDWERVRAAGASFAVARVTVVPTRADGAFGRARWEAMAAAGLVRGALLAARPQPEVAGPEVEVSFFWSALRSAGGLRDGDMPPVLAVLGSALTPAETLAWTGEAVAALERLALVKPILLTSAGFWIDTLGDPRVSFGCPLWVEDLGAEQPRLPRAWDEWALWRYSARGRMDGVAAPCGLSSARRAPAT
jgi:lysozyme